MPRAGLGHCCSNTELQRISTFDTQSKLRAAQEQGVIIPPNILTKTFDPMEPAANYDNFEENKKKNP